MFPAMNSRGTKLIAVIAVALLLAILWANRPGSDADAVEKRDAASTADVSGPEKTVSDPKRTILPTGDEAAPKLAMRPQFEQTPTTVDPANAARTEARVTEQLATPAAAPVVERDPQARRLDAQAECWGLRGSAPRDYAVTLDHEVRTSGEASALISSRRETSGYTTMFQTSSAAPVKGKRVEFSADVRTRGAKGSANLLLRAEDAYGNTVAFDNMATSYEAARRPDRLVNRGVMGDSDWSTQHVVVDIPAEAVVITYGMSLFGSGQAWIDNARIEVVTQDMPTTAIDIRQSPTPPNGIPVNPAALQRSPRNLEFEFEAQSGAPPCN